MTDVFIQINTIARQYQHTCLHYNLLVVVAHMVEKMWSQLYKAYIHTVTPTIDNTHSPR